MIEQWRIINLPKYGLTNYEVSDLGRIRHKTLKIIKSTILQKSGYCWISLYVAALKHKKWNHREKHYAVSKLVMRAFIGEPPPGLMIEHLNQNKRDNRLSNLSYMTQSENIKRNYIMTNRVKKVENKYLSQATYNRIKEFAKTNSQVKTGKAFGLNNSTISKIMSGVIKPRYNGTIELFPYMTQSENIKRSYDITNRVKKVENKYLTKATHDRIKEYAKTNSQVKTGQAFGLHNSTISKIMSGKIKPRPNGFLELFPTKSENN